MLKSHRTHHGTRWYSVPYYVEPGRTAGKYHQFVEDTPRWRA